MLPNLRDYEVLAETRRAEVEQHLEESKRGKDPLLSSAARKPLWKRGSILLALRRVLNIKS